MTNVLVVPEKNEGTSPLSVVEEGLKADSVDEVYVIDGWSTDDTVDLLNEALPELAERYGKAVSLYRSRLRNTGKGGAMVTGMEVALREGHSKIAFVDADISSLTSLWFDYMIGAMDKSGADMTRGYFDRSPFDAQITRHITVPAIHMFFPEGHGINQPLGGELCMRDSLVRYLLEQPVAPPHTWGIDTFLIVTSIMGGFKVVELYLAQKLHKGKTLGDLADMLPECFDEMAKLIYFHGRHETLPLSWKSQVVTVPRSESPIERIGADVRTLAYTDLGAEVENLFEYVKEHRIDWTLLSELGIGEEEKTLVSRLLRTPSVLRKEGGRLDARTWVGLLNGLLRGYIARQFSGRYWDLLYALWRLRAVSFFLNEARTFEEAEENSRNQARHAVKIFEETLKAQASR